MGKGTGKGGDDTTMWVGVGCYCVVFIVSVILFGVSWDSLEPTEVGLDYNGNTLTLDETQLYEGGRYMLGLGHYFIKFNKTLQTVKFSKDKDATSGLLQARTKDGLAVTLDISYQYRIVASLKDCLGLFKDFSRTDLTDLDEQYKQAYSRISRDVLRNVAAQFDAFEFFKNRTVVSSAMRTGLNTALSTQHANVDTFQLINIDLPDKFENAIQRTEITRQEFEQAQNEQVSTSIVAQTRVLQAEKQAEIIVLSANASADAYLVQQNAVANALEVNVAAERDSFFTISQALGFNTTALLKYVWLKSLAETQAKLTVEVDKPAGLDPK